MSKTITLGLGEWHFLICLIQKRMQEIKAKECKFDENYNVIEKTELSWWDQKNLIDCERLYKELCEQGGLR